MGSRWRQLPAFARDALASLATAFVWFGGFFSVSRGGLEWSPYVRTWVVTGVALFLAILLSRRYPRSCLTAAAVLYPIAYASSGTTLNNQFAVLPVLVVGFVVTGTGGTATRWALGGCILSVTALVGLLPAVASVARELGQGSYNGLPFPSDVPTLVSHPSEAAFSIGATVAVVLLGASVARVRRTAELLAARNAELMELRERESQRVVAAERTRIARELHDVVAHHVSAIVIRAQAADRVADQDPSAPRIATQWIAATGQDALAAMRQVVKVLRKDEAAARAPEEGLEALAGIADRVIAAGLDVDLRIEGGPPLAAHVQLAAVRIVQEALTNSLVHAQATSARVHVSPVREGLLVSVDDDGTVGGPPRAPVPAPRGVRSGNGLVGMRERAQSCGGWLSLTAGPRGGWCVTALLCTNAA